MMPKFMLSVSDDTYLLLSNEARERGIGLQELLRAVIIADWVKTKKHGLIAPFPKPSTVI
jgi:hypothetical protein